MHGMSEGFHTKISQLARRKDVSMSSYAESRPAPIWSVLCGSLSIRTVVFVCMSGVSYDPEAESFMWISC